MAGNDISEEEDFNTKLIRGGVTYMPARILTMQLALPDPVTVTEHWSRVSRMQRDAKNPESWESLNGFSGVKGPLGRGVLVITHLQKKDKKTKGKKLE